MSETDETSGRGRRPRINILPWVADEPGQDGGSTSAPPRRVPPSGLIAAPSPGAAEVPLTPEPWLPPVRRVAPAAESGWNGPGWPSAPPHQPPYGTVPAEGFAAPADWNTPDWSTTPGPPPRSPDGWAPQAPPPPPPWASGPPAPRWGAPAGAAWPPAGQAPQAPREDPAPPAPEQQPATPWDHAPAWPTQTPQARSPHSPREDPASPAPEQQPATPWDHAPAWPAQTPQAPPPHTPRDDPATPVPGRRPATPWDHAPAWPTQTPPAPQAPTTQRDNLAPPVPGQQPATPWDHAPAWPTQTPPASEPTPAPAPRPVEQQQAGPEVRELPSRRRVTADAINHERILGPDQVVPRHGWRARVHAATGGRLNVGLGAGERRYQELLDRVRRPLHGSSQIAISSIKGGVGKTTVAACLGLLMAEYRGDGVVALDADPDAGTLADRLTGEPTRTVRDLLGNLDKIGSLSDFSEFTTLAGRLRVLAGEQDPAMGEAFRREEYEQVCQTLTRYFPIVITDSGTGMVHDVMRGILTSADRLVVVGSLTVDGASRASKTLDWLLAHGHEQLADEAILVLCSDRGSARVDRQQLRDHFDLRCNDVIEIPADDHLYSGGKIEPALLAPATREAFLNLSAVVADGFR